MASQSRSGVERSAPSAPWPACVAMLAVVSAGVTTSTKPAPMLVGTQAYGVISMPSASARHAASSTATTWSASASWRRSSPHLKMTTCGAPPSAFSNSSQSGCFFELRHAAALFEKPAPLLARIDHALDRPMNEKRDSWCRRDD